MLRTVSKTWPTSAEDPLTMLCMQGTVFAATSSFSPAPQTLLAESKTLRSSDAAEKWALLICPVSLQWQTFCCRDTSSTLTTDIKCNVAVFPYAVCNQVTTFVWSLHNAFILFHHQAWFAGVYRLCCVLTGQESKGSFFSNQTWIPRI